MKPVGRASPELGLGLLAATAFLASAPGGCAWPGVHPPAQRLAGSGASRTSEERQRIEVFRRICPSVVHVEALEVRGDPARFNVLEIPLGMGSGFVWDRDGHVVTNLHVIRNAEEARVLLKDGSSWRARVMGTEPAHDVAVLMIDAPEETLAPLEIDPAVEIEVGQTALAVGNPFGLDHTLSVGVVSALGRDFATASGAIVAGAIQIDAAINPGNSGGPLLDSAGRLIGINTALVSPTGAFAGIGFAVPVRDVQRAVARILGEIPAQRPGLGIRVAEDAWARELGLPGVLVLEVFPGGPAERAGVRGTRTSEAGDLLLGDVILAVDGVEVGSRADLTRVLAQRRAGEIVSLSLQRAAERLERSVAVALERHR